jgi:hypothetical protein
MNNKINIAEKLKDYPNGLKLYSPIYGEVKFYKIDIDNESYPIAVKNSKGIVYFAEDGRYSTAFDTAECLLFPSSKMRDWTKFFKRGDVVWSKDNMYAIFEGWANDDYTKFNSTICIYAFDASFDEEVVCYTDCFVKAREEERATFITNAEKHYNGKYNPDTLQVEPVKPKCQFKPFDKVLVRDGVDEQWRINIFSHHQEKGGFPYVCMSGVYRDCIPYNEDTAQLLNTTSPYMEGGSE